MAMTARTADPLVRWFERAAIAPAWLGVAIMLGYLALWGLYLTLRAALGLPPIGAEHTAAASVTTGMLLGYLPAMNALLHRGLRRDLENLRPALHLEGEAGERRLRSVTEPPARLLWSATVLGALLGGAVPTWDPVVSTLYGRMALDDPDFVWTLAHNMLLTALGLRVFAAQIHWTRSLARLGREPIRVDLLDVQAFSPLVRAGQRSIVAWVLMTTIFSLYWVSDTAARANVILPFAIAGVLVWVFVAPLTGVHRAIRATKQRELERVADAIRRVREQVLAARPGDASTGVSLADLVAYHRLIDEVREWPIDVPGVLRIAAFLLVGLGSWLGGALVERGLDTLLR